MDLIEGRNGTRGWAELPLRSKGGSSAEAIIHVVGDIDIFTEPALTRCLDAHLHPTRHLTSLVVDLSSVAFVGVRGLAALLVAATNARSRDIAFCLVGCGPQVLRLLALIDLDHVLTVRAESGHASSCRPTSSGIAMTGPRLRRPRGFGSAAGRCWTR